MTIKGRLAKLEKISGVGRMIENPLIIRIASEDSFSPEDIALFRADDDRQIAGGSPLVVLMWTHERLAELRMTRH